MLAPHELKNKPFSKSIKGYNPAEVDEYIEFLIGKYTEVYRENNELERKLHVVVTNLDEIKDEEESIRSTLISAQKMADRIVKDASDRADVITGAVKERCDAVIAEFREQLKAEKEEMWELRTRIVEFKKQLFDMYRGHIESVKNVSVNELDEIVLPDEDAVVARIFTDVKQGVEESNSKAEAAAKDELAEEKKIFSFTAEKPAEDLPTAQEAEDEFLRFMMEDGE
ncbi:MAG: DivIVA domain-containing protein [Clostridia bacterium]|jgi:cell division initiation protein|nr:DivIVA domain-containing protein [Clostridia bacterium]MBQ5791838.1 DivIVA domain-containing protein [Clostridia bacterium]